MTRTASTTLRQPGAIRSQRTSMILRTKATIERTKPANRSPVTNCDAMSAGAARAETAMGSAATCIRSRASQNTRPNHCWTSKVCPTRSTVGFALVMMRFSITKAKSMWTNHVPHCDNIVPDRRRASAFCHTSQCHMPLRFDRFDLSFSETRLPGETKRPVSTSLRARFSCCRRFAPGGSDRGAFSVPNFGLTKLRRLRRRNLGPRSHVPGNAPRGFRPVRGSSFDILWRPPHSIAPRAQSG